MNTRRWHTAPPEPDPRGPLDRAFTPMPAPCDMIALLPHLERVAQDFRDDPVIVAGSEGTTYLALMRMARRLASDIAARHGDRRPIIIAMPEGSGYLAAVIACLAIGRVAVLLDDLGPSDWIADIIQATGAGLVLGDATTRSVVDFGSTPVMDVEGGGAGDPDAPLLPTSLLTLDDPAFVLCTSGSTGRPKPIVHSQRTLYHWARTTHNALGVRADDRALSLSSPGSLGGFSALLSYPLAGASLQAFDLRVAGVGALFQTLLEQPVTILRASPSTLRDLCKLDDVERAFSGLRVIQAYGEPLTRLDVEAIDHVSPPGCLIRTTYGSTECSGMSWFARPDDLFEGPYAPAGRLMPETEAALVDDDGRDIIGEGLGELWIRSAYNALGELSGGRLTRGALEPDPLEPEVRIFRTGDLAWVDPSGVWFIAGRKDRMLKVDGRRLEPAQIEAHLRSDARVVHAEVVSDADGRLLAFVIPEPNAEAGLAEHLREHLRLALPAYMTPSRVVILDAIPLLPSGKVDTLSLLRLAPKAP